jgi:hypothetical protein
VPNLTIFNGDNSQQITLTGLTDNNAQLVSAATVTGILYRNGAAIEGGGLTFTPVTGQAGNYVADLDGFDAPDGRAVLIITGENNGASFKLTEFVTIADRSL